MKGLTLCLGLFRRGGTTDPAPDGRFITSDGNDFLTSDGDFFLVA